MNIDLLPERLQALLIPVPWSGCWLFTGSWTTGNGYGKTMWEGSHRVLHKVVYELLVGPVCPTFQLDHKCRVRCCCNPAHLSIRLRQASTRIGVRRRYSRGEKTMFGWFRRNRRSPQDRMRRYESTVETRRRSDGGVVIVDSSYYVPETIVDRSPMAPVQQTCDPAPADPAPACDGGGGGK